MNARTICGAQRCRHIEEMNRAVTEIKFIGPKDSVRSPSGLPMLIQKNAVCNAPGSEGN